jgi:hypothetical protein
MRNISIPAAFLAASLLAAVALAASDKVVVSFVSQASSGVNGDLTINAQPQGGIMIHGRLQGLEPNVEYVSQHFADGACSSSPATELATFKSNPMGKAVFTAKSGMAIADLKSISVQLKSDLSLKACATVNP